ncbi:MAG: hypothetical protein IE909_06705, partial [Campylobacterales bacterium]|nr:hypothetical protein [Campylobacterales bacterium]
MSAEVLSLLSKKKNPTDKIGQFDSKINSSKEIKSTPSLFDSLMSEVEKESKILTNVDTDTQKNQPQNLKVVAPKVPKSVQVVDTGKSIQISQNTIEDTPKLSVADKLVELVTKAAQELKNASIEFEKINQSQKKGQVQKSIIKNINSLKDDIVKLNQLKPKEEISKKQESLHSNTVQPKLEKVDHSEKLTQARQEKTTQVQQDEIEAGFKSEKSSNKSQLDVVRNSINSLQQEVEKIEKDEIEKQSTIKTISQQMQNENTSTIKSTEELNITNKQNKENVKRENLIEENTQK